MNIKEFREKYQEYDGMSDFELGTTLHQKYYSAVPYEEFAQRFGAPMFDPQKYGTQEDDPGVWGAVKRVGQKAVPSLTEAGATAGQWIAQGIHALGKGDFLSNSQEDVETITAPVAQGLPNAAQYFSDQAQSSRSEIEAINREKPSHLQGRVWDNPEMMGKSEWWIEGVGDAAVSLVPTLAAHALSGGSSVVGGTVGGWMEGSSLYNDLISDGIDDKTAKLASSGYGIISATLNALGLEKVFGKDAAKGIVRRLLTGAIAEGSTEYLEEPAQAVFESLARGENVGQAQQRFIDSLKNVESGIFGGILGGGMSAVAGRGSRNENTSGPLIDEPAPQTEQSVKQQPSAPPEQSAEFNTFPTPKWNAPAVPMSEEIWNREAKSRGWNHLRNDIPPKDDFLQQEDQATEQVPSISQDAIKRMNRLNWLEENTATSGARQQELSELARDIRMRSVIDLRDGVYTPPLDERARRIIEQHTGFFTQEQSLSKVLNSGNTVDLLAMETDQQRLALPMAGVHGVLGLPAGSGAMPMGTLQSGLDPIAPPTEFAGLPVATPYVERPALPEQSTMGTAQGRWAGGRSQLAYGRPMMGMADALGMGGAQTTQQPAQAIPTQAQITGIQQAPRADTTAHAEALGMPAPQVMPEQDHAVSVQPDQSPSIVTLQAAPAWSYELPSLVGKPYTQPAQDAQTDASGIDLEKLSRAQLIAMLPKEIRPQTKKLDKPAIRELIRTQAKENENAQVQIEAAQQNPSEIAPEEQALPDTTNELN